MRCISCSLVILLVLGLSFSVSAGTQSAAPAGMAPITMLPASDDPAWSSMTRVQEHFSELDEAYVLLIEDFDGWSNGNEEALQMLAPDVTYDLINSASLATTDLSPYTFVVVAGDQDGTFNQNILNNMSLLQDYVDAGGWLQFHMGTNTHTPHLMLWDGTTYDYIDMDNYNYIGPDGGGHPIFDGLTEPFEGNWASHGILTVYPPEAAILAVTTAGNPTMAEYGYGAGNVVVSTMTLEFLWTYDPGNAGQILYNMMVYMANRPPLGPVQIDIIPDVSPMIVPQGGTMGYSVHVTSTYPPTVQALAWISMEFPNGQIFGPLRQAPITISNGMDLWVNNLHQNIPINAPLGLFKYHLSLGMNLGHPLLDDYFRFTVTTAANQAGGADNWDVFGFERLDNTASAGGTEVTSMPDRFTMAEVYPNPFNPAANISVSLPEATELNVSVFNVMGQQVATLSQGQHSAGTHNFVFDGSNLSSGIYFVRAATGNGESALQRIVLMK